MSTLIIPLTVETTILTHGFIALPDEETDEVSGILLDCLFKLDGVQHTYFGLGYAEPFVLPPMNEVDEPTLTLRRPQPSFVTDADFSDPEEPEEPTARFERPTFDDTSDVKPLGSTPRTEGSDDADVVLFLCRPKTASSSRRGPVAPTPVTQVPRPASRHAAPHAMPA